MSELEAILGQGCTVVKGRLILSPKMMIQWPLCSATTELLVF